MKNTGRISPKEHYQQLRALPWSRLWSEEARRFDTAAPQERRENVAVVRAVGVVFSESGDFRQKEEVAKWLRTLLQDPEEKVRRYAMAALPKIGAEAADEAELLSLLGKTTVDREKKFLGQALNKIGGAATLEALAKEPKALAPRTEQKVRASVARTQEPSTVRLEARLGDPEGLVICLQTRRGLEEIVRDEVQEAGAEKGIFRVEKMAAGRVSVSAKTAFSLGELFALRCFSTAGFLLGDIPSIAGGPDLEALAAAITSPKSRRIFQTFTEGALRYRLDFLESGHQRGAVRRAAELAYDKCPELLNDSRSAPWSIDVRRSARGYVVELRPRLAPDPRFLYRQGDVPAASHPPLAACLARLAGREDGEVVWDPFCGSGLELVERDLRGGVCAIFGTDRSPEAVDIAYANLAAAGSPPAKVKIACADFRDHASNPGLGKASATLVITNPPLGKRVPVRDLRRMVEDLFLAAATVLKPGGRLVFVNPVSVERPPRSLELQSRQLVDLGGFDCWLEKYVKRSP